MKILMILAIVALGILAVSTLVLALDNARLRRQMKGLDEPELWLPKTERQAHARKLLAREEETWRNQQMEDLNKVIQGYKPIISEEIRKGKSQ